MLRPLLIGIAAFSLCGCGTLTHPALNSETTLPLSEVKYAINCEITNAIKTEVSENPKLIDWQGAYSVTFKANHTSYAKLNASTFPIELAKSSMLNLGVGGGVTSTASRTGLLKFTINFADVATAPYCERRLSPSGHPFVDGEFGFGKWLHETMLDAKENKIEQITSVGHTFEFQLDFNAGVSPSFIIGPVPTTNLNPTISVDRLEDNILEVAFGKGPARQVAQKMVVEKSVPDAAQLKMQKSAQEKIAFEDAKLRSNPSTATPAQRQSLREIELRTKNGPMVEGILPPEKKAAITLMNDVKNNKAKQEAILETIRRNPRGTIRTVTTRYVRVPAASPEVNPNVNSTLQSLQLERLVGRIP